MHVVRQIAIRLPGIHLGSVAFGVIAVTADTAVLCTIAVVVFGLISGFHDDATRRFRWIAFGALLVSFLPLLHAPEIGNLPTVLGVAAMHAGWENDYQRIRPAAVSYLVLVVLQVVALARFPGDFAWGSRAGTLYLAFLAWMLGLGVLLNLGHGAARDMKASAA